MAFGFGAIAELPISADQNKSLSAVEIAGVFCTAVVDVDPLETDQDRNITLTGVFATAPAVNGVSSDFADIGSFVVLECDSNFTLVSPSTQLTGSTNTAVPSVQFVLGSGYLVVGVAGTGVVDSVRYEEDRRLYIGSVSGIGLSGALFTYSGLGTGVTPTFNLNTPNTPGLFNEINPSTTANYNPV